MSKDYEHEYECEDCEGMFIIKPDLEETITYCPQCGSKIAFKNSIYIVQHKEDKIFNYDTY